MSDDKKKCPPEFIKVGATSVLIRHALADIEALYKQLDADLEAALVVMKSRGMAKMEIAEGQSKFHEARGAVYKVMEGHCSWKRMLDRHGIANPTDDDILSVHQITNKAARGNFR